MAKGRAGNRGEKRGVERREEAVRRIERAMLELCGERGYRNVTVADVLARSGSNRHQFYRAFDGKAACFGAAYAAATDALVERLLAPCSTDSHWATGMRGSLEALAGFLTAEATLARGVLAEAGTIGGAVRDKRQAALTRLEEAVDGGRREPRGTRPAPPRTTARFLVSAIEAAVARSSTEPGGEEVRDELADLLYLAIDLYLGPEAARAEVRAFRASGGRDG